MKNMTFFVKTPFWRPLQFYSKITGVYIDFMFNLGLKIRLDRHNENVIDHNHVV